MIEKSDNRPRAGRQAVISGIAWTTGYRVFATLGQFGAMLVLVRIIPPVEYGRAGAVVGILALLNVVSCGVFVTEALQHRMDTVPDWSLHWQAGWIIQLALFVTVNAIAGVFWFVSDYRSIAPLTHVAAIGLLLECPSSLRNTMLRRAMDFRRLRVLEGIAKLTSILVILSMGFAGLGAMAIVVGSNVVPGIPATLDLLIVRGWRPEGGWWRWPDWGRYHPSLRFGLQRGWSAALQAGRGAVESAVFPISLGFGSLGLFQRAQALFSSTVGHVNSIFQETTYPLMPSRAHDEASYRPVATLFLQIVVFVALTGAAFVAAEGAHLSRVLYGEKWIAADPLIAPASLLGFGVCLFTGSYVIVLAKSQLRTCFLLDVANACFTIPVILLVATGRSLETYAWALGAGQTLAGAVAFYASSHLLSRRWSGMVLAPPLVSASVAAAAILIWEGVNFMPVLLHLLSSGLLYATILSVVMRAFFPEALMSLVGRLPLGATVARLLRLRAVVMPVADG